MTDGGRVRWRVEREREMEENITELEGKIN